MENAKGGAAPAVAALGGACCGCGACAAACPKGCIEMQEDGYGFSLPAVDSDRCVGCGACERACPAIGERPQDGCERVLWVRAKDGGLLERSSSGGVFGLLARRVLDEGGLVIGAAWADGCGSVRHVVVNDAAELDSVMRSKYVQSSVGSEVYCAVREALRSGRRVLFSGTACQIAGMRGYLGGLADSDGFLAVDVICHGVPSPLLWSRWVEYVGSREGGAVTGVNMRSKAAGWQAYSIVYGCTAGKGACEHACSTVFNRDWYMKVFLANASLCPSCYVCPVKRSSGSDITLGDFWGVQQRQPEAFEDTGVSAVIANTPKGLAAVEAVLGGAEWGESSLDRVVPGNPSLVEPVKPYGDRDAFMAALAEGMPIPEMMRRWDFGPTFRQRSVSKVKGIVKRLLEHLHF